MKAVSIDCNSNIDTSLFTKAETKFGIQIREDIKQFLTTNAGGYPIKSIICSEGEEYEIRVFLSLDKTDQYYCLETPLNRFLEQTNGKIIPIGVDSEDNYYCVNNETGKVYYWSSELDNYYCIAISLKSFTKLFE